MVKDVNSLEYSHNQFTEKTAFLREHLKTNGLNWKKLPGFFWKAHFLLAAMDLSKAFSVETHTLTLVEFSCRSFNKPKFSTLHCGMQLTHDIDLWSWACFNFSNTHTKRRSFDVNFFPPTIESSKQSFLKLFEGYTDWLKIENHALQSRKLDSHTSKCVWRSSI